MMQLSRRSAWPSSFDFEGFNEPLRMEVRAGNLLVEGRIPDEIDGAFFRATGDPAHIPLVSQDTMLSGDGMVSRFRIQAMHVDFDLRYVRTARFEAERVARRALFGMYRNPFTDEPAVRGIDRTVANTTPIWHAGRLFMAKEDGHAYEIDPETLETRGSWTFGGKLRSETMTPHPRIDPNTGEMFFFGYEAGGLCTRDVAYCIADPRGELISEQWFQAPYCAMLHDFAITERYAIFPIFPTTADLERLKAGGPHWIHEPRGQSWIAIMPRYGNTREMRWFKGPVGASGYHIMNAFDDGDQVHLDLNVMETNIFPFIRAASGIDKHPADIRASLTRWTFDLSGNRDVLEEKVIGPPGDMPRIAAVDQGRPYSTGYYATYDPRIGPPNIHGVVGAGFNALLRIDVRTGKVDALALGPDQSVSEPIHIASSQPKHEGWLAAVVDSHAAMSSSLWVIEAEHPQRGAIAKVRLPMRLRPQTHGNWVTAAELASAARKQPNG